MVRKLLFVVLGLVVLGGAAAAIFRPTKPQPAVPAKSQSTTTINQTSTTQYTNGNTTPKPASIKTIPSFAELGEVIKNQDNDDDGTYTVTSVSQPYPGWLVAIVTFENSHGSFIEYSILEQL